MNEIILEAIVTILGADIALLVAYLAYISPKYEPYRTERRNLLDKNLYSKIGKICKLKIQITIESFLPFFKEYEIIEEWGNILRQVCQYLGYSIFLQLIGLIFCLFNTTITIENVPVQVFFAIAGGIYFLAGLYTIVSHAIEVNEWKVSKKS